jgi:hypothetical protein
LTALNLLVRGLSFKTQFKIEFLGPFYGPKKSLKKPLVNVKVFHYMYYLLVASKLAIDNLHVRLIFDLGKKSKFP